MPEDPELLKALLTGADRAIAEARRLRSENRSLREEGRQLVLWLKTEHGDGAAARA